MRAREVVLALLTLTLGLATACSPEHDVRRRAPVPDGGGGPAAPDEDGDGISDTHEGRPDAIDTESDGTPDYLDDDSDGDGIGDAAEAGTIMSGDTPRDSDGDGTPDFRDDDSDGNGIPDGLEGNLDTDSDGDGDFRDTDNDGDRIGDVDEIGPDAGAPIDSDGDGVPDHLDTDSDADTIADQHEGGFDTDMDGTADYRDLDSDADGYTDAEEAGDADEATPPVDTDMDLIADFRDPDSDGDGLGDREERDYGTSRTSADSDGDGVTDLIEIAACPDRAPECSMDPTDGSSSPRTRGDFVFFEPYMEPPDPPRDTLVFSTDLQVADVYFLMDTTGSMGGAIASLKAGLSTPGTGLIDLVRAEIPDVWFGVGGFDDYQVAPYGYASSGDHAYYNLQDLTADVATAQAAVNRLTTHYGGDGPESMTPALHAVASGLGLGGMSGWSIDRATSPTHPIYGAFPACPAERAIGWPCFRSGAVPIVVSITDIQSHNGPGDSNPYTAAGSTEAPAYATVIAALTAARVRVIGIAVYGGGLDHLNAIATATGAVDAAGSPLTTTWSGGSIGDAVVRQIQTLANQTPLDISIEFIDDPTDAVESYAAFVDHLEANTVGDPARGCDPRAAEDTNGDGFPDTFRGVRPGSPVCFDIIVKQNDTVMPLTVPQIFKATLRVLGDGFTELDSRDIFFLVPPTVEIDIPG